MSNMKRQAGSVRRRHARTCPARERGRCRGSCTWSVRFYGPDGRQRERGGFSTRRDAEAMLREELGKVDRGAFRDPVRIGFADLAERWLATSVRPSVRPATFTSYEGAVRNHLVPYFGSVPVTSITREQVERFLAEKLAARRPDGRREWSPKTIHNVFLALRKMLATAEEWNYLASSPAARVKPVKRETPERQWLSAEELADVLRAAEEPWRLVFRVAALTALRRGELLGLRWGDVELDRVRLHVRQTFGRYGFAPPKSAAGRRVVPLSPALVGELRRWKLAAPPNPGGLVFASRAGTPLDPDNLVRAWERALRRAGLRHLPFHSLRHTAVSLLIAHERLNPKQLQTMIGHASIEMTFGTYGHLLPDSFDGFGRALDALDREGTAGGQGHNEGTRVTGEGTA